MECVHRCRRGSYIPEDRPRQVTPCRPSTVWLDPLFRRCTPGNLAKFKVDFAICDFQDKGLEANGSGRHNNWARMALAADTVGYLLWVFDVGIPMDLNSRFASFMKAVVGCPY